MSAGPISTPIQPHFPQPVKPPKGAPNVLLILIDDAGFGQFGTFGGGSLARDGQSGGRGAALQPLSHDCSVLADAGRADHRPQPPLGGFGVIGEIATGYDGYTVIPGAHGTVGEVLRYNGYSTAWFGKNHNMPTWESRAAGPFDHGRTAWASTTSTASMAGT